MVCLSILVGGQVPGFTVLSPCHAPAVGRDGGDEGANLVGASLAGDAAAFAALVRRYRRRLLHFVDRMIHDRERAEDLVQETFVRVYRHLHRFDRTRKFTTWVYTIASNLAKNELRDRARHALVFPESTARADGGPWLLQAEDVSTRPDRVYQRRYLGEAVDRCVAQLPEHHREVFVLREMEGRTYEDIAGITGCQLGTVKSRLSRARRSFARAVAPYLD